jgi:hypothetical protein
VSTCFSFYLFSANVQQTTATEESTNTITDISTVSTTTTTTVPTTVTTADPKPFTFVASYTTSCTPYNYLEFQTAPGSTYNDAFQFCAGLCRRDSRCVQIYVGYMTSTGGGPYNCLTGGGDADHTWVSSEIQCNLPAPPYSQFCNWYSA